MPFNPCNYPLRHYVSNGETGEQQMKNKEYPTNMKNELRFYFLDKKDKFKVMFTYEQKMQEKALSIEEAHRIQKQCIKEYEGDLMAVDWEDFIFSEPGYELKIQTLKKENTQMALIKIEWIDISNKTAYLELPKQSTEEQITNEAIKYLQERLQNDYPLEYATWKYEDDFVYHYFTVPPVDQEDTPKHDTHYKRLGLEPWDILKANMTYEEFVGFLKGNIQKYLHRNKEGLKDYEKLVNYANKLVETVKEHLENGNSNK